MRFSCCWVNAFTNCKRRIFHGIPLLVCQLSFSDWPVESVLIDSVFSFNLVRSSTPFVSFLVALTLSDNGGAFSYLAIAFGYFLSAFLSSLSVVVCKSCYECFCCPYLWDFSILI